jgi:hypothetical protein
LEAIMDTKMDGLKREIMEGLKKFLIDKTPRSENVSHEIHDEDTRKMNQEWRKSNLELKTNHFPKIDMRKFDGKDPITWILEWSNSLITWSNLFHKVGSPFGVS